MDVAVFVGLATLVAGLWCVVGAVLALLAGRVIHERDAHDRPVAVLTARH